MSDGRLLRVLGVGFGLAVIIGNAIGAGIFRAPGQVAAHLRDPGLFLAAWAAGGLYALIGAIQIAELGTMLARSCGQYVFSRYALGEYAGFPVFARQRVKEDVIYIPTRAGLVAPYRRKP